MYLTRQKLAPGLMDMWWKVGLVLVTFWGLTSSDAGEERWASDQSARMLRAPVETLDFGFVPSVVYETHAYYEPGPIGILFHVVHAFLYLVQPNPFPKGETQTLAVMRRRCFGRPLARLCHPHIHQL
ncbi:hypothetical protein DNTS_032482 [Danionella cerebrum]|uniref:Uncharacterized protein n=1 Tax=Danionella cerebrum TaxID=2873325 RepID=A0A553QZ07_9TELE|nr:hypothetical protein DNTS_032482 [Danionella translucida]